MKYAENLEPQFITPQSTDSLSKTESPYASSAGVISIKNFESQTRDAVGRNADAASMLEGFSLASLNEKPKAKPDITPVKEERQAQESCAVGYATHYNPRKHHGAYTKTADGTTYTGSETGVAIDLHNPVLGAHLGDKLRITNLENGKEITVTAKDKGGFGRLSTPEPGVHRLVDATSATAQQLGSSDMTKVEVCLAKPQEKDEQKHTINEKAKYVVSNNQIVLASQSW